VIQRLRRSLTSCCTLANDINAPLFTLTAVLTLDRSKHMLQYQQHTLAEEMIAVRTIPWIIYPILNLIGIGQSKGHSSKYIIIFADKNSNLISIGKLRSLTGLRTCLSSASLQTQW